jgi:hypothetical protein
MGSKKTSTTTTTNNLNWDMSKWMAKTSTTTATTTRMELASWVMQGRQETSVSRKWNKRG